MEIVRRVHGMHEIARQTRASGRRIGFVPTMGALHDGHMSLVRDVRCRCDVTVVSVFVNPTQFGGGEDFARYPRDLTRDADLCVAEGVDFLFAPEIREMYPEGACTFVDVEGLSTRLEGASRPGHFRGVATVVLKLFEIVCPHIAAFGQKDAQQVALIRKMVRDLLVDVQILTCPIVRDHDGLALSSRNVYLSADERLAAAAIPRCLAAAEEVLSAGERDPQRIVRAAREVLESELLLRIDYVELVDPAEMLPVRTVAGETLLVVAAFAGTTRLIDNTILRA